MAITTLITVTYNSEKALQDFWANHIPEEIEWIVVDNNSSDDSVKVAKRLGATVIELATNLGFSKANNIGFESSEGDYVYFVNPDVTVDFDTIPELNVASSRYQGIVSPRLLNNDGSPQPNARGIPSIWSKILGRLHPKLATKYLLSEKFGPTQVWWVMGAAIGGERLLISQIGGWDETFFLYYEDSDICLRAWMKQIPVFIIEDCHWIHGWARETAGLNFRAWSREIPSLIRFYKRYPQLLLTPDFAEKMFMRNLNVSPQAKLVREL